MSSRAPALGTPVSFPTAERRTVPSISPLRVSIPVFLSLFHKVSDQQPQHMHPPQHAAGKVTLAVTVSCAAWCREPPGAPSPLPAAPAPQDPQRSSPALPSARVSLCCGAAFSLPSSRLALAVPGGLRRV